jgi:uncharacterized membrane protein SirB2
MMLAEHYLQLRTLHITCVVVSIALFVIRHALTLWGVNWRRSRAMRIMPHIVDSLLLLSAVLLAITIEQYPFVHGWVTVKVIALVTYIVLGMQALKPNRSLAVRRIAFMAAVIVFGFIVTVARTHSPWGIFAQFIN